VKAARAEKSDRAAKAARIPVRGAKRSQVKSRAAVEEAPRPARSQADLAETRSLAIAGMEAALDKRALEPVLIDVSSMGARDFTCERFAPRTGIRPALAARSDFSALAAFAAFADLAAPADAPSRADREPPCLRWTFPLLGDVRRGFFT